MSDAIRKADRAAQRLCALLRELDQSTRPGDLHQVLPGIHAEAGIIRGHLRMAVAELEALEVAAVADSSGKVRSDAPATSRAAARAVSVRSGSQRARVLLHLWRSGPETDLQLQEYLTLGPSSERPRRGELVDMGLVAATDRTKVHNGVEWTIWSITRAGEGVARSLDAGARSVPVREISVPQPSTSDTVDTPGTLF